MTDYIETYLLLQFTFFSFWAQVICVGTFYRKLCTELIGFGFRTELL